MFTILDSKFIDSKKTIKLNESLLLQMYLKMVCLNVMDNILYECQRQGRISFYMTNFGEEAVQIGSAAALSLEDLIYAQYREAGVLLWRGFNYSDFVNQCYGNYLDGNKGKQMPVHYGAKNLNFVTISSPLTTQLPQAVGSAYGYKYLKKNSCVVCYFGEGAASEGDFHAALNFAATLHGPIVFICRNNMYAISTPAHQQYASDGIAIKGVGYGIKVIRVDGNDIAAVYEATKFAKNYAVKEKKPVLIEAMTYRIGHHSTSDDSTAYRKKDEINAWTKQSPISRLRHYLEAKNLWNQDKEDNLIKENKKEILNIVGQAEKQPKPLSTELFTDVYKIMPEHIKKQMHEMENHLNLYKNEYSSLNYKS